MTVIRQHRHWVLLGLVLLMVLAALLVPRFDQPADYNDWVDTRSVWGIPHFGDVVSNIGFLWVGALGLWSLARGRCRCDQPGESLAWALVFAGVLLTGFGSSYYHWEPDNARLVWDRLPMVLGFMALLSALLIERVNARLGRILLPLLVVLGGASVFYWYWSYLQGAPDLRFYVLVQLGALSLVPALLWLYPPVYSRGTDYLVALGLYGLAMVAEALDAELMRWTGIASGHNLKHLIAALAVYWLLRMLRRREPV